jgi:hypothetical protein
MVVGEAVALALARLQLDDEILPPFANEMKAAV